MDGMLKTKKAYAELDEFISLLDEEDRNKIPDNVKDFFKKEKDKEYKKNIKVDVPIDKQNLMDETLALIALLYLRYICNDENEKERLKSIYSENERNYREEIKEKYDPEMVLDKRNNYTKEKQGDISETKALVVHKESIFKRLLNRIKQFFKH